MSDIQIYSPAGIIFGGNKLGVIRDNRIYDPYWNEIGHIELHGLIHMWGQIYSNKSGYIGKKQDGYWYDSWGNVVAEEKWSSLHFMDNSNANHFRNCLF